MNLISTSKFCHAQLCHILQFLTTPSSLLSISILILIPRSAFTNPIGIGQVAVDKLGTRRALLIANQDYKNLKPLKTPINDINEIGRQLTQLDFQVQKYSNLDANKLEESLSSFSEVVGREDFVLFYYAGHAVQWNNDNYMLPIDISRNQAPEGLTSVSTPFSKALGAIGRTKLRLFLFDACRDLGDFKESTTIGLARMPTIPRRSIVMFSTQPGVRANDGRDKFSPFAEALVDTLKKHSDRELEVILREVKVEVHNKTRSWPFPQTPIYFANTTRQYFLKLPSIDSHTENGLQTGEPLIRARNLRTWAINSIEAVIIDSLHQTTVSSSDISSNIASTILERLRERFSRPELQESKQSVIDHLLSETAKKIRQEQNNDLNYNRRAQILSALEDSMSLEKVETLKEEFAKIWLKILDLERRSVLDEMQSTSDLEQEGRDGYLESVEKIVVLAESEKETRNEADQQIFESNVLGGEASYLAGMLTRHGYLLRRDLLREHGYFEVACSNGFLLACIEKERIDYSKARVVRSIPFVRIPEGIVKIGGKTVAIVDGVNLSKYEITQQDWIEVIGNQPSFFRNCGRCPVEMVSWDDVQEFLMEVNRVSNDDFLYRLPTDAEWQHAALLGDVDSDLAEMAWYVTNSDLKTHEVGKRLANGYGMHDMYGNVWEWVEDSFDQGDGADKVRRGGSWGSDADSCTALYRGRYRREYRSLYLGFRLARVMQPKSDSD